MAEHLAQSFQAEETGACSQSGAYDPDQVGASEDAGTLRLWKASQAVRHGEMRLAAQAQALANAQSRVTSIFGWLIPAIAVAVGALTQPQYRMSGIVLLSGECAVGILAFLAILPLDWGEVGIQPHRLLDGSLATELEWQEAIAQTYANSIIQNQNRLTVLGRLVTCSWVALVSSPLAAAGLQLALILS